MDNDTVLKLTHILLGAVGYSVLLYNGMYAVAIGIAILKISSFAREVVND